MWIWCAGKLLSVCVFGVFLWTKIICPWALISLHRFAFPVPILPRCLTMLIDSHLGQLLVSLRLTYVSWTPLFCKENRLQLSSHHSSENQEQHHRVSQRARVRRLPTQFAEAFRDHLLLKATKLNVATASNSHTAFSLLQLLSGSPSRTLPLTPLMLWHCENLCSVQQRNARGIRPLRTYIVVAGGL